MARAGVEAGCTEALFTLGDKPELLYDQAKHEVGQFHYGAVGEGQEFSLQYMVLSVIRSSEQCNFMDSSSSSISLRSTFDVITPLMPVSLLELKWNRLFDHMCMTA